MFITKILSTFVAFLFLFACQDELNGIFTSAPKPCPSFNERNPPSGYDAASLSDKEFSLIIEGGPTIQTKDIAILLRDRGIKASFFFTGDKLEALSNTERKGLLESLRAQGHLIANGGYSGRSWESSPYPALELRRTALLLEAYIVGQIHLFRSPLEFFNESISTDLHRNGLSFWVGPIKGSLNLAEGRALSWACEAEELDYSACSLKYYEAMYAEGKGLIPIYENGSDNLSLLQDLLPRAIAQSWNFLRLDQVPEIRSALKQRGALLDTENGPKGCEDHI